VSHVADSYKNESIKIREAAASTDAKHDSHKSDSINIQEAAASTNAQPDSYKSDSIKIREAAASTDAKHDSHKSDSINIQEAAASTNAQPDSYKSDSIKIREAAASTDASRLGTSQCACARERMSYMSPERIEAKLGDFAMDRSNWWSWAARSCSACPGRMSVLKSSGCHEYQPCTLNKELACGGSK